MLQKSQKALAVAGAFLVSGPDRACAKSAGLAFEGFLEPIKLWHQWVADGAALRRRGVNTGIEPAHLGLQDHRSSDQLLQLHWQLAEHLVRTRIGGAELDLGLF